MTSFADYVASKPMQDQKVSDIEHYAVMLCDALYLDIKRTQLRWHESALEHGSADKEYHENWIMEIHNNGVDHEYYLQSGRKYYKLIHKSGAGGSQSVHAFINKTTGDVLKPATWQAPAKGVRYNLLDDSSREECYARADWAGGYLYNR
jgi:hypothetical protein